MSDNNNEKKRSIGLFENRVSIIGRVRAKPKLSKNKKYSRVPLLIPSRRANGDTQWIPIEIDVASDKYRDFSMTAKPGDYFRCSAIIAMREVTDDEDYKKKLAVLQLDDYDSVGIVDGGVSADTYLEPNDDGMCVNDVFLLGKFIQRKKQLDAGQRGPELREKGKTKYTFVNMVYNDPRDKEADGIWIDLSVFGPQAEIASKFLNHLDQVYARGELTVRDTSYLVKGKVRKEIRVGCKPYGFQFVSLGGKRDSSSAPSGADTSVYEDDDDEDIPF